MSLSIKQRILALGILLLLFGYLQQGRLTWVMGGKGSNSVQLGINASLGGRRLLPDDNPWNQDISREPVDPNSQELIKSIGLDSPLHPDFGTVYRGVPNGIPYVVVAGEQKKVPIRFRYESESDPGPYPIPADAPIEGGPQGEGDRHVIVLDRDNWKLYETFSSFPDGSGGWKSASGAIFDLKSNKLRPAGWTSADAAGLPILPGLVRYDEAVESKKIEHALRFTVERSLRGYVYPATHFASARTEENLPPMGMRVRLRASYDVTGFPPEVQVILRALQQYGMIVADNGGTWYLGGVPDPRWNDDNLHTMKKIKGRDFEVIRMGRVITR